MKIAWDSVDGGTGSKGGLRPYLCLWSRAVAYNTSRCKLLEAAACARGKVV